MSKNIYEKIGFSECPFMEAGAATNVTPYLPASVSNKLDALIECLLGGQVAPFILGGAAGSGKTTITRYYFRLQMHDRFKKEVSNSLSIFYTITDSNELRDILLFYKRLIKEVLSEVNTKSTDIYNKLITKYNIPSKIQSNDAREMLKFFGDLNRSLHEVFSPLIYVIDEVDYVVDLINEKNHTFVQHLRHIIDLFCEIRHTALILASTKLSASYIRGKIREALGPTEDRISQHEELKYSEEDFLKFVETRFTEPIIEIKNGEIIKRTIRSQIRDALEREHGAYFPFTEDVLRHLYRRVRGPEGVALQRLRLLERNIAKLINVFCSEHYALSVGMTTGKIFTKEDIDTFLITHTPPSPPAVELTPEEEEWFDEFFGFRSDHYRKFAHEKCLIALTLSLSKYLETKYSSPGALPFQEEFIRSHLMETRKGLKFLSTSFNIPPINIGWAITLLRDIEIDNYGWESLEEIIESLYSQSLFPQKKIIVICAEDDFEFNDIASKLVDVIRQKEIEKCIQKEDIQNIEIINDKLMIKSANSFCVLFIKHFNLVEIVSIIHKKVSEEILKIGEKYFRDIYDSIDKWTSNTYDFINYKPSMERILQAAILYPAIGARDEIQVTDRKLRSLFDRMKHKGDPYLFNDIRLNGFLREVLMKKYRISIPPTLVYFFKNYKQFDAIDIEYDFGKIGLEISEFLKKFLGFQTSDSELIPKSCSIKIECESTKTLIKEYEKISGKQDFNDYISLLDGLQRIAHAKDFQKLDKKMGLDISADFIFTKMVASRYIEKTKSVIENKIRQVRRQKKQSVTRPSKTVAEGLLGKKEEPRETEVHYTKKDLLEILSEPKTLAQLIKEYSAKGISEGSFWKLLKELYDSNEIEVLISPKNVEGNFRALEKKQPFLKGEINHGT